MKRSPIYCNIVLFIVIPLICWVIGSCSGEDPELTGPPVWIEVFSESGQDSLPADGESYLVMDAIVHDEGGNRVQGALVYFSTTLGSVKPMEYETDWRGISKTILHAGLEPGEAVVTARLYDFQAQCVITFY